MYLKRDIMRIPIHIIDIMRIPIVYVYNSINAVFIMKK